MTLRIRTLPLLPTVLVRKFENRAGRGGRGKERFKTY